MRERERAEDEKTAGKAATTQAPAAPTFFSLAQSEALEQQPCNVLSAFLVPSSPQASIVLFM